MSALLQVYSLELRKLLSYRFDFWVKFLLPLAVSLAVAYFLWGAIFAANVVGGNGTLRGYSFHGIMLYYLLATLVGQVDDGAGWKSGISVDIFEGTLTRYLIYPIWFFGYKLMVHLANNSFAVAQLLATLALFLGIFGSPVGAQITWLGLGAGLVALLLASVLSFLLISLVDMAAFWVEHVWSLQVMLRFTLTLTGGSMIPLEFFPEWAQRAVMLLPFPCLYAFPIRSFMGTLSPSQYAQFALSAVVWIGILSLLLRVSWRRGLRQYTGVGM